MDQLDWDMMPNRFKNAQAKHLIKNCDPIYKIKQLWLYDFGTCYIVVNSESLFCKIFETENEGVNYCLDAFKTNESGEQLELL